MENVSWFQSRKRLLTVCLAMIVLVVVVDVRADAETNKEGVMWQTLEWSVCNSAYEGNPFDVVGRVTFKHESGQQSLVTEMFYDGGDKWKFRFTGTRGGRWTFTTKSDDADLDGQKGSVTIKPNPDPNITGFLTHQGNKFAIQSGNDGRLQGYLFTAYMQRKDFDVYKFAEWDEKKIKDYCTTAKYNGFEIIFLHLNNQWLKLGKLKWSEHKSENPDLKTFALLDKIITTAHSQGCRVHLWAWGDESRKWTPIGLPGGINGKTDRRLQRYIAARLGPLPGWTLGYGFDLHEWVTDDQVNSWAQYLHEHFGFQHLLCARGKKLKGPYNMISYSSFGRGGEITTTNCGPENYQEILEDIKSDTSQPHFYEERHSHLRKGFKLDMDGTRHLLWWETMVGGMGGFFGFYSDSPFPYPNPEQLRCHHTFWHKNKRFFLDMKRANKLTDGYCLKRPNNRQFVFYRENTDSIRMNLSKMKGRQPLIVVDTKKEYKEIKLPDATPKDRILQLPYISDWAVAVGSFAAPQPASYSHYKLEPGQVITYEGSSKFKRDKKSYETTSKVQIWVVKKNEDGTLRLIAESELGFKSNGRSDERSNLAMFDIHPDGGIESVENPGCQYSSQNCFIILPSDTNSLRTTWETFDKEQDIRHVYSFSPRSNPHKGRWVFQETATSRADEIYGISRTSTVHFNSNKGLVEKIEMTFTQTGSTGYEGGGTIKLKSIKTVSHDFVNQLALDAETYFRTVKEYRQLLSSLAEHVDSLDTQLAKAKSIQLSAGNKIKNPIIAERLNEMLSQLSEGYPKKQAERQSDVLNRPSPDWEALDFEGRSYSTKALLGKVVVLDFWYRGCGWCIRAMPQIKQVADYFKNQPVVVLGMNTDKNPADAKFVIKKMGLNYPNLKAKGIPGKYAVRVYPTLIVIDQDGIVRSFHVGYSPVLRDDLVKTVEKLLKSKLKGRTGMASQSQSIERRISL